MNAVITGATEGIGKACAIIFAQANYNLHLSASNERKLKLVQNDLQKKYPTIKVEIFATDLSIQQNIKLLSINILKYFRAVDVLINNVGKYIPNKIQNQNNGELENMLQINLYSAYYLTQNLLPTILTQNHKSYIFNMCSVASLQAYPNGGAYSISKYALLGFSENLRDELKNTKIKVCSVCPGATLSKSWEGSGVDTERIMEANDIAKSIFYITQLSDKAVVEKIILRPQQGDL